VRARAQKVLGDRERRCGILAAQALELTCHGIERQHTLGTSG
jgi:hypothetical protein